MKLIVLCVLATLALRLAPAQTTLTLSSFGDPKDPAMAPTAKWAIAAFKDAGYDLVIDFKPGERALIDANAGVDDGDLSRVKGIGIESAYPNLIMVPEPLTRLDLVAYASKRIVAANVDDLARQGLRVAVLLGNKIMDNMVKPKIAADNYQELVDLESAFKMLSVDRADVLIVSDLQARSWLSKAENAAVHPVFTLLRLSTYTFLNKKWAEAVPKIAASYKKLASRRE